MKETVGLAQKPDGFYTRRAPPYRKETILWKHKASWKIEIEKLEAGSENESEGIIDVHFC